MPDFLRILSPKIYDPANRIDGVVNDIWVQDGKIVPPPSNHQIGSVRTIDANGLVAMPGGVDMHCHIAGSKVNAARKLRVDDKDSQPPILSTPLTFSGTGGSVPSTFATAYRYAAMGYTTAFDAAVPPLLARQAHFELEDTPCIDKGFYTLVGNNVMLLEAIAKRDPVQVRRILSWLLDATCGYAPKIVNPGGVENWKQLGTDIRSLDEKIGGFDTSPRQVLQSITNAANELKLPHPVHIHTNHLGLPGNWNITLETMKSLNGLKAHLTHIQFHSYDGGDAQEDSFGSKVQPLADYINQHPELSVDVGQVLFGDTTSMTGDGPVGYFLSQMYRERWVSADTEMEAGCGIVPIKYRNKSLIHAWQWVIGLEWYLLVNDPWQVVMSTDHPNGGSFQAYPQIIRLLMDKSYRDEMFSQLPQSIQATSVLKDLKREYSLSEIAIITRSGPAKLLGLKQKGHLGVGADADITLYLPNSDYQQMFAIPRFVIKAGHVVIDDCEIRSVPQGDTIRCQMQSNHTVEPEIDSWIRRYYSVEPENFRVNPNQILQLNSVQCPPE